MKKILISIALLTLLTATALALRSSWIMLGTAGGMSFEISPIPVDENKTTVGLAKNVYLEGEFKGIYVIHHLEFDCPSTTFRQVSADIFKDDKLVYHSTEKQDWTEVEKNSYAWTAIRDFWCKNLGVKDEK